MRDGIPQAGHRQPAPAVVDVIEATSWDPYLSLRALAAYSSLSERLLRSFLNAADHPLPHYRVGGRLMVKRSEFDGWMQVHREPAPGADADAIVERLLADLDDTAPRRHARRG